MAEQSFSPEQSLQLIRNMISKTKQDMSDNSIYFLVWVWITLIACTGQFILKNILHNEKHYLVWLLVVPGIIFSIYQGVKDGKKRKASTYVGESMKHLWTGMGVSFFVLSIILTKLGWGTTVFPFFIMLYGMGTFISGSILRFRPLIIGGVIAWALAAGAAWVHDDYQMLFAAAAILFSYIIPAYMLRRKNNSSTE